MKFLSDRYIRAFILIGMGIYFIINHSTRPQLESVNDLIDFNGRIESYSFTDNTGWRRNGRAYYLFVEEYPNKFQIKADYLKIFNKALFENSFKSGSRVKLSFPKHQEHLLGTEEAIILTSLIVNGTQYLSKMETIELETSFATSNSVYILGIIFCVAGVLIFVFYDKIR